MAYRLPTAERIVLEAIFDLCEDEPQVLTDEDLSEETGIAKKVCNLAVNNLNREEFIITTRKGNNREVALTDRGRRAFNGEQA